MTGMTDISRHGGDKSNRDELDIKVKDDALVDPALLAATSANVTQFDDPVEILVDDSDDDDGYDFGDAQPGFATKVVQMGCKLLFFPLIFLYKGVMSLQHTPWLCGQIWQGIKTGTFFKSLFSPSGRLGKTLIVIGTVTGVVWISRKISQWGASVSEKRKAQRLAREQADEEAALEREILAEEAAKNTNSATTDSQRNINVQPGNGQRKATAVVQFNSQNSQQSAASNTQGSSDQHAMNQTDDDTSTTEGRKKFGFGQLNRFAAAFKRSQKTGADDTASGDDVVTISSSRNTLVDDNDDSFDVTGDRWSQKKKAFFAAACLLLLVGGVTVAKQVMRKDADVAVNDSANQVADSPADKTTGVQPKSPLPLDTMSQPQNQPNNQSNPYTFRLNGNDNLSTPPASNMNANGISTQPSTNQYNWGEPAPTQQPVSYSPENTPTPVYQADTSTSPQYGTSLPPEQSFVSLETPNDFGNGNTPASADYGQNSQASTMHIEVDDAPVIDDYNSAIAVHTPGNTLDSDWNASPTVAFQLENTAASLGQDQPQSVLATTPRLQPSDGGYQLQPLAAAPMAESSLTAMPSSTMSFADAASAATSAPSLADIYNSSHNASQPRSMADQIEIDMTAPGNTSLGNTGLAATPRLTPMGSAVADQMMTSLQPEISEVAWDPMPSSASNAMPTQLSPNNTLVLTPDNPAASSAMALQPLDNEPIGTMGLADGGLSRSNNTSLQPTVATAPMIVNDSPMSYAAQAVSVTPRSAVSTMPPMLSDELQQNVGSGIVSPTQQIMTAPMVTMDSQNAAYTAPMIAQPDAGTVAYSAQPQPIQSNVMQQNNMLPQNVASQPTNGTPLVNVTTTSMTTVGVQGNAGNSVYIVQQGDSIYKIAKQELGSARRYREIYDLNRDHLPIGQDTLTAGTELLLPGR